MPDTKISGLTAGTATSGDEVPVNRAGTNYKVQVQDIAALSSKASTTEVLTGTDTAKTVTPDALAALWEKGSDVASAATISLGEGNFFHITGTTTITDIDFATPKNGRMAVLEFDDTLLLTYNSTTLTLPGKASILTAAGDMCIVVQDSSDNVHVVHYMSANYDTPWLRSVSRGFIWGLTLSNAADAANDITVGVGAAAAEESTGSNYHIMQISAGGGAITKRIDAAWAVGSGNGGMNTGAVADSTWYEVHLIRRPDTGVVDVMFTTTANRTTLPANYTQQRRIGWVRRGSATNLAFTQVDDHFTLTTQVNDASVTATATAAAITLTAPPDSIARFRASTTGNTSVNSGMVVAFSEIVEGNVTPADTTGIASLAYIDLASPQAGHFELRVNSASAIEHDSANSTGSPTFDISTFGWIDHRRRMSAT